MKTSLITISTVLLFSGALAGCNDKSGTVSPDDAAPVSDADTPPPEDPTALPAQDPDPAALGEAQAQLELGNYEAVTGSLEPLLDTLTQDSQLRAHAIASALLSIARGVIVAEQGKEAADAAMADAARLGDPEVEQFALTARGAYLVGVEDAVTAQADLEKAANQEGAASSLARLYLGEALLNQAFDADGKIADTSRLDAAQTEYDALLASDPNDAMKGRAETGLAAIATLRKDKEAICIHARAAEGHYKAASAAQSVTSISSDLLSKGKCK